MQKLNAQLSTTSSVIGALGKLNKASRGSALITKRLGQAEATINAYVAANKALKTGTPPLSVAIAAAVLAQGLANVVQIESQNFATGGIVQGNPSRGDVVPANLTAGELVLNQAQQENLVGNMGNNVTVNISAPLVDETIVDTIIPAIQSAISDNRATLET